MKIFIDSADVQEIRQGFDWCVVDGVTTNPSLLKSAVVKRQAAGEKVDMKKYIQSILEAAKGTPVSLEVTAKDAKGMIEQGKRLYEMFNPVAHNVNIKIPVNPALRSDENTHFDGIRAISELSAQGIPINCTLIFTPEQALLASKAGARYLSPFAGRVDDHLRKKNNLAFDKTEYYPRAGFSLDEGILEDNGVVSGIHLVEECIKIVKNFGLNSEVLAASMRNPRQVREAAVAGAHISTLPFGVIENMLKHHKTFEGMKNFLSDVIEEYDKLA